MSDIQVIGVDISDSRDFTAISGMCGKCKKIIYVKLYDPTINQTDNPLYTKCPVCGAKIKIHIIV